MGIIPSGELCDLEPQFPHLHLRLIIAPRPPVVGTQGKLSQGPLMTVCSLRKALDTSEPGEHSCLSRAMGHACHTASAQSTDLGMGRVGPQSSRRLRTSGSNLPTVSPGLEISSRCLLSHRTRENLRFTRGPSMQKVETRVGPGCPVLAQGSARSWFCSEGPILPSHYPPAAVLGAGASDGAGCEQGTDE